MSSMRGLFSLLLLLCLCGQAVAYNLNYGTGSLPLTADKKTFPSLAVQIGETVYYGALFTYPAQTNTIRLDVNGTLYWAGVYCAAGTYSAKGHEPCSDCGAGYYCTGGLHRAACTGGVVGCPCMNHAANDAAPSPQVVQSGLIVYLDAAKNCSGHKTGALVWKDLSGNGNDFEFVGPTPTFGPSSITLNQIDQYARSINNLQIAGYSAVTVEIRYKVVNPATQSHVWEHTINWNYQPGGFGMADNIDGSLYSANECHTNQFPGTNMWVNYECNINDLASHTNANTFSSVSNPTGRLAYFDAVLKPFNGTGTGNASVFAAFTNAQFFIGRRGAETGGANGKGQRANTEVQSLRIYNRQLSPAEICQNAWADYNRFGGAAPGC